MTYKDVKYIRQNSTAQNVDNQELSKMIDDAIEKQIPKKPEQDDCARHIFYCPTCTRCFNGFHKPHHCECGQALDWSE